MILFKRTATVRETLRGMMMVTTVSGLLLACIAFAGSDLINTRRSLEEDLTTLADVIGSNSAAALMFADKESDAQILDALEAMPNIVAARVYTGTGRPFVTRRTERVDIPDVAPPEGAHLRGKHIEITRNILFKGEKIGTIFIASNLNHFYARMRSYGISAGVILLVSILVAFAISSKLQTILSVPIHALAGVADRVRRERNYGLRISPEGSDTHEVTELMFAFNEMLAEIQLRDEELQRRRDDLEGQVVKRTTELRVAKDRAERVAHRNQEILNTAAEGILELDAWGVVTFINHAAARMLGYSVDELTGSRLHDLVHVDEMGALSFGDCPVCRPSLRTPVRAGIMTTFVASDGRRFPVEYSTAAVPAGLATGVAVVVTFRDVTQRMQVERMKDEFVSTVSHELRTPLTSIRGALGLLASGALGALGGRAQRMLDIAVGNTDRLVRMINEILDLERISSGRVELNRSATSASVVMRDAVDVVQNVAERAGVAILYEPDDTLLWIDRDRIVQTLTNLLGNAVKFSPRGSRVVLRGEAGEMFAFSVEDQGRGIPFDQLDTIFERFRQVDASDSRDKGGTGLGLAICRSIVHAHGGAITVDSIPGVGSAFHFSVPLAVAGSHVIAEPAARRRKTDDADAAVLIIEDDSDLARVISATLESHAVRSIIAASGEEAIDVCARLKPALVILDLMLPNLDGFAVVQWLRDHPDLASLPLLVYSATEVSVADQARLRLGTTIFLTKSRVPLSDLEQHVRALLYAEPAEAVYGT